MRTPAGRPTSSSWARTAFLFLFRLGGAYLFTLKALIFVVVGMFAASLHPGRRLLLCRRCTQSARWLRSCTYRSRWHHGSAYHTRSCSAPLGTLRPEVSSIGGCSSCEPECAVTSLRSPCTPDLVSIGALPFARGHGKSLHVFPVLRGCRRSLRGSRAASCTRSSRCCTMSGSSP